MPTTPAIAAVALYTGVLAFVLLWLGTAIAKGRGRLKISIGDGGNPEMVRLMRSQANFVENTPMALLIMLGMALLDSPVWLLHLLGVTLVVARVLHGLHFTKMDAPGWQRTAGAGLTGLVLLVGALGLIGHGLANL